MTASSVVVVGGGNAALCAAIAAAEAGAKVTVLEAAPRAEAGGNSAYTAGLMRVAFGGLDGVRALAPELGDDQLAVTDFGTYTEDDFLSDLRRVTDDRCDTELARVLVSQSLPTLLWMREHGVRFVPAYGRQAFEVDGRYRFWGGAVFETAGQGPGLVRTLTDAAERLGVRIVYEARALELAPGGVRTQTDTFAADAVVLACGGFEANADWRARHLGPGWELAKVRGTRHNVGDGIRMALDAGASEAGDWSGCHAVGWDLNAPDFGDLRVGHGYQKHSYPFGIMVNARGERFCDEGADFRNYTYAAYGRRIAEQPGRFAWQIFDSHVTHLLRDEYRIPEVTKVVADSIESLADRLAGVDAKAFCQTVAAFNRAVRTDVAFDPNVLDGRGTTGLSPPKSNWANPIERPPLEAYAVTCGITFTFGGVRIDAEARVMDASGRPIPALYACGEMAAGLFHGNYPGGAGLTAGSVYGRIAGRNAARMR